MGKLVMAYWDCPYCGGKGNRGDAVNCPSCGRARGDVKFYMKDYSDGETREADQRGEVEYLSDEQAQNVGKNPDWYCSFCNSLNSDNAAFCGTCGASRENSEANYFEMLKQKQAREQAEKAAQPQPASQQRASGSKKPLLIILAVAIALVGIFVFLNGNKTTGDLQIASVSWERVIDIEENREFSESGWSLPDGAELTGKKQEIHHYDSVLDHYDNVDVQKSRQVLDHYETYYTYEDRGNGTYEEVSHERPVYKTEYYTETERRPVYVQVARYSTKYYYKIWRWVSSRQAEAHGDDQNPQWPQPALTENEREGQRGEVYRFTVQSAKDNSLKTYRLAEADWRALKVGDPVYITAKRTGKGSYLSDEKGNKIAEITPE